MIRRNDSCDFQTDQRHISPIERYRRIKLIDRYPRTRCDRIYSIFARAIGKRSAKENMDIRRTFQRIVKSLNTKYLYNRTYTCTRIHNTRYLERLRYYYCNKQYFWIDNIEKDTRLLLDPTEKSLSLISGDKRDNLINV